MFLLAGLTLTSCDLTAPLDPPSDQLSGTYALVRITGGFAGIDTSYQVQNSPQTLRLQEDGTLSLTTDGVTSVGAWSVDAIVRRGDTLSGTFAETSDELDFAGYRAQLVADEQLFLDGPCCDFFNYTFVKR